ncbi:MAG TPA: MMPL family transporter [Actinomycetota bacterium]
MSDRTNGHAGVVGNRFHRLGAFAFRRRWPVLIVWLVVLVLAMPFLQKLSGRLSQGGFEVPGSQSDRVRQAVESDFHQSELTDSLVLRSTSTSAVQCATTEGASAAVAACPFADAFHRIAAALARPTTDGFHEVIAVADPFAARPPEPGTTAISGDGHLVTARVSLAGTQNDALKYAKELQGRVDAIVADDRNFSGSNGEALLTGAGPFYREFSDTTTSDLTRAEQVAFPVTLLILLLAFGGLVAAGMPLITALFSLLITFGIVSIIAANTTVSIFTENIASMIGIGVGIDYSLFILTRYREETRRGRPRDDAIALAIGSSGQAVFVSALTVVVALAGTQLVRIQAFRSMGWGAMIAVAFACAAALTLLPALVGLFGKNLERIRIRRTPSGEHRLWHRWAMTVMRRPWPFLIGSTALLLVLAIPALRMTLGSSGPSILPADSIPRRAAQLVAEPPPRGFGEGQIAPVQILVVDPQGVTTHGFHFVYALTDDLQRFGEVVPNGVHSIANLAGNTEAEAKGFVNAPLAASAVKSFVADHGRETLLLVVTRHGAQSAQSNDLVERIRTLVARTAPPGLTAMVGGDPGLNVDINHAVGSALVPVVALVMLLSFLVLMVFFRSLLLPLKAVLMTTASVLAVYGVLVFVFQDGHFQGLLGFDTAGHLESFLPLFLFCILFGLSMDYEVFLLARIREEYRKTGDNTEAVGWGLEHTASIITSAAAIMITVFGAFALASLVPIKAMGFGLAIAVLIDATVVRLVLVPATMRLLGNWNWWIPRWLDRILPNVALEGSGEPEPERVPATVSPSR